MTYSEVVEKAKYEIKIRGDYGTANIRMRACSTWLDGDQINLWTYWQGYQVDDVDKGVDILLVGQDWGNPWREGNEKLIENIEAMQKGIVAPYPADSPTDSLLKELFACFGCDITLKNPGLRLFFTNYSLGYRTGSETGGIT